MEKEGRLVTGGTTLEDKGNFVLPTVFSNVAHDSTIMQEEIFGPVVGFSKAKDFTQAIEYANATEYGLTGAVISNNRDKLEQARRDFMVGNLYFNRGCTGAVVGYHHLVVLKCQVPILKRWSRLLSFTHVRSYSFRTFIKNHSSLQK